MKRRVGSSLQLDAVGLSEGQYIRDDNLRYLLPCRCLAFAGNLGRSLLEVGKSGRPFRLHGHFGTRISAVSAEAQRLHAPVSWFTLRSPS